MFSTPQHNLLGRDHDSYRKKYTNCTEKRQPGCRAHEVVDSFYNAVAKRQKPNPDGKHWGCPIVRLVLNMLIYS